MLILLPSGLSVAGTERLGDLARVCVVLKYLPDEIPKQRTPCINDTCPTCQAEGIAYGHLALEVMAMSQHLRHDTPRGDPVWANKLKPHRISVRHHPSVRYRRPCSVGAAPKAMAPSRSAQV